jgi:hypothetical protein
MRIGVIAGLENKGTLGPHIEEEIEDTELRDEAPSGSIELMIGLGEVGRGQCALLGAQAIAVVRLVALQRSKGLGRAEASGIDLKEGTEMLQQPQVQPPEAIILGGAPQLLQFVYIVLVVGTSAIGRGEGLMPDGAPLPVRRETHLSDGGLRPLGELHGNAQRLHAVRPEDVAAIAVALLDVVLGSLEAYPTRLVMIQEGEVADGRG